MREFEYAAILGWRVREEPSRTFKTQEEADKYLKRLRYIDPNGWPKSYAIHKRVVIGSSKGAWNRC